MSFDKSKVLKRNLIEGFKEGSFSEAQTTVFATNYNNKDQLNDDDYDEVMDIFKDDEENDSDSDSD